MRSRTLLGAALATAMSGTLALGTAAPSQSAPTADEPGTASPGRAQTQAQDDSKAGTRARKQDAIDAAARYLARRPASRKAGDDTIRRSAAVPGTKDTYYVSYRRTLGDLPVFGGDFVVAVDGAGEATGASQGATRSISVASTTPTKSRKNARRTAKRQVATVRTVSRPTLVVYAVGKPTLAWRTKVTGTQRSGTPSIRTVFTDARTGAVLLASEGVHEGSGNGYYYPGVTIGTSGSGSSYSMTDATRSGVTCGGQNGSAYTGTDNVWGNGSGTNLETACVDVLYGLDKEIDMLSAWLGRSGVKGNGTSYPARVGLSDVNAYFNGSFLNFGHSSDNARQLTAMDIVAHEAGHGIFQTTPGGSTGGNETGGLNEATGDIFGALTEAYANNPDDPADYLVGEEADLVGQGPIRNMANPSAVGDPNCYSSSIPNTEVHAAAGPLNHWFYLLAEGTNGSTTCNGTTLSGLGIQTAGKIFYNGLLLKTSSWTHGKARVATLTAAKNLYGSTDCSTFDAVKAAWAGISVPAQSGEPTCGGGGGTPGGGGTCSETTTTGSLSNRTSQWKPSTSGFTTSGGTINACLTGPSSADFDLYLQKKSGSSWYDVAASESASSTEQIAYSAGSGTYRIEVYSYSGSGSYTLKYDTP
ncbi:MAG: M4 family metallopeptidase [Nocardioides sp.]|uniref:M4 family metallopeptidase n=1 Tax=Nocardioides sp. TaxID=35761 RepID=UPI000C8D6B68|nr:M4 family metallopeptidase [Nocardioides sp.]MAS53241.1 peptidase M4 family protein [Pimelobacter sp.]MDE0777306.1 M4 family metallopeptidase [Nocardioides sp.]